MRRMLSIFINIILGVVPLISGCICSSSIITPKPAFDEKTVQTNFSFLQIDPDIAEDAKLTTVSDQCDQAIFMKRIR